MYPNIRIETYSPPYKAEFSEEDNRRMIEAVNRVTPDLLWVGMTAPKQEKWAYAHLKELDVKGPIGTIGAVFDFLQEIYSVPPYGGRNTVLNGFTGS